MRSLTLHRFLALSFLATGVTTAAAAQTPDPILGTWILNVAKSKYTPGPGPKSETRTYVISGGVITASNTIVDATGKSVPGTWTVVYDSKYRAMTGDEDADSLSVKRVDAHHYEFSEKKGNKVVVTGTRVIAADGKSITLTTKGTNAKGQAFTDVVVYDKKG